MDALLLALLLTLTLDQGSGTQHSVARLADSGALDAGRIGGLALILMLNAIVAAALGGVMAAMLMPDARLLFLAIALLIGGAGHALAPFRTPVATAGSASTGIRGLALFALRRAGENGAFATAGVVAFTDAPVLAAIGATLGGWVALAPPLALGGRYAGNGLLRLFQLVSGAILLCIAIGCGASALHIL